MQTFEPIEPDGYYHIYNRGINGCMIFDSEENYKYFLRLVDKYLTDVLDIYSWCLMNNHFHFLIKVKESAQPNIVSRLLSNMFNSYAQAFNKQQSRHGALFERPFKRKKITSQEYLLQLVLYIHNNPVHHGIKSDGKDYKWSSYNTCLSDKPTKLLRDEVILWFEDKENFIYMHNKFCNIESSEEFGKW